MKNRQKDKLNKKFVQNHKILQEKRQFWPKTNKNWLNFPRNKQGLRANGFSLHPLALRPGLVMPLAALSLVVAFTLNNSGYYNSASAASITLSIPNTLSLDISGASPAGTFAKSSKATVSTKTDSATGYTLSVKAKEAADGSCLKNGENKITSISSNMTEEQFRSSAPVNTWGFQPDKFNSALNSNFLPGPTATESVIDKTKTANVLANNYGIVLAAKINTDLPAGTYKNTYTLSATANALTYSVHYNLNSGSGGPSPNPQTGQTDGSTFKLSDQAPTRDGFDFKGWCMTAPEEDGSCKSGIFQPGDNFVIYCDESGIELYAMWEIPKPTTLQDFANYCSSMSIDQTITLQDTRDGKNYTVAKLKDKKCWMTKNLEIADKTLTNADSDVASSFTLPESKTSGFNSYDTSYVYVDNTYGGYYSWFAATAGEGTQSKSSGDVSHSICPKGWRLPTQSEFQALTTAIGGSGSKLSTALLGSPNNFKKGGRYYYGKWDAVVYGFYWSASAHPSYSDRAYSLKLSDSSVDPADAILMEYGLSVRCVARQ